MSKRTMRTAYSFSFSFHAAFSFSRTARRMRRALLEFSKSDTWVDRVSIFIVFRWRERRAASVLRMRLRAIGSTPSSLSIAVMANSKDGSEAGDFLFLELVFSDSYLQRFDANSQYSSVYFESNLEDESFP